MTQTSTEVIVGVGVDSIALVRVARALDGRARQAYLARLFSPAERDLGRASPADPSNVARAIALKEATYKASSHLVGRQGWHAIHVGQPIAAHHVSAALRVMVDAAWASLGWSGVQYTTSLARGANLTIDAQVAVGSVDDRVVALAVAFAP